MRSLGGLQRSGRGLARALACVSLVAAIAASSCTHRPVAPPEAPRPIVIDEWLAATPPDDGRKGMDVILESLLRGSFLIFGEGDEFPAGVKWSSVSSKDGVLQFEAFEGLRYVAAVVHLDRPVRAMARVDGVTQIFVNGVPQPGDPYRSGCMRVPLTFQAGDNHVVAGCMWRGAAPIIQIQAVDGEVAFNMSDLTLPDLREGETIDQFVGVPVLNFLDRPVLDLRAQVLMSDDLEPTTQNWPALAPLSVTKIGFCVRPRRPVPAAGGKIAVRLRLSSRSLGRAYEQEVSLDTVSSTASFRRTFVSKIDGSIQYYAVTPPPKVEPGQTYGLILSLHGASVEAIGLAKSYSPKDWAYVVCPTNRRPFGFDWEDWGRLDGLEVLENAQREFSINPRRVYLTGHSMGGHGTWNVGVLNADRFAVIAPSAGWCNFASYGGARSPTGRGVPEAFARAAASSETQDYLTNLAGRGVFIIHGDQDDNVPVEQGRTMRDRVKPICPDLVYHEQPGAGHWWDGEASPGADCVDWPPLMEFMQKYWRDSPRLDFRFVSPSPWSCPRYSFLEIQAATNPYADVAVDSTVQWFSSVRLETKNVASLKVDGRFLRSWAVHWLLLGDQRFTLSYRDQEFHLEGDAWTTSGWQGKRPGLHGPFKEVFTRPFCFVYPDGGPRRYRDYASYLVSVWCIRGNGTACAVPASNVSAELAESHNLVYLGGPAHVASRNVRLPVEWSDSRISLHGSDLTAAAGAFVYPDRGTGRLMAWIGATRGCEHLLFCLNPFRSGVGLPDYMIWDDRVIKDGWGGALRGGFFDSEWRFDEALLRRENRF